MLLAILSICSQEELVESEEEEGGEGKTEEEHAAEQLARRQAIKNKILAVGRMQRVFQLLRYVMAFSSFCRVMLMKCRL